MIYTPSEDRYGKMLYNRSGKSGVLLPAISLGLWHNFGSVDDFENGRSIIRRAFDRGITHFQVIATFNKPGRSCNRVGQ